VINLLDEIREKSLGKGLSYLVDALHEEDYNKIINAAEYLEFLCDHDYITKKTEPVLRFMTALTFEICGESYRSKRSYFKLFSLMLPLDNVFKSIELAKMWTQIIYYFGMRNTDECKHRSELFFEILKKRKDFFGIDPEDLKNGDFIISLGLLDFILSYIEFLERKKKSSQLLLKITSLIETAEITDTSSWLVIISRLYSNLIKSIIGRSILNLNLPLHVESYLINQGITELWLTQNEAIKKGILKDNNFVYATDTATGKSLLAYLVAGTSSVKKKIIYIVPTRTLANEAFYKLKDMVHSTENPVAISTREITEYDNRISEYAVITSTYEKFYSLIKQNKIEEAEIKTLIADEIHFISEEDRGIPLEFTLSMIKNKPVELDPQIITLSAMIPDEDAIQLSEWLSASLIRSKWRPVALEECIFLNNKLYYDDGRIEEIRPKIKMTFKSRSQFEQKNAILNRLARDIIVGDGQCMVVVRSRKDAEKVAIGLSNYFNSLQFFDSDIKIKLSRNKKERNKLVNDINMSEPELPICAKKLIQCINHGVAYHHAGLPMKYRGLVEKGTNEMLIKVLVTTTTFEVGVNLPMSTVIFLDLRKGNINMPLRSYKNLAGRAGRPEYDVSGKSIIITLNKVEFDRMKKRYFETEIEPLESGIKYFLRKRPIARYAVQSQILETISRYKNLTFDDLMNVMKKSWFWSKADSSEKENFTKGISTELWNLENYGQINRYGNNIQATNFGHVSSKSMLSPFSIRNLVGNARRIFSDNFDDEKLTFLILSLVGIPYEIRGNDDVIKQVRVPERFNYVTEVLKQDEILTEPDDRIQLCSQYATMLWYWIHSLPTEEILLKCGLDPSADAALLEELLPNDAHWILSNLGFTPPSSLPMTEKQRNLVLKIANDCKYGTSYPIAHKLLSKKIKYFGRNTAVKLCKFLNETSKDLNDLTEADLIYLFSENQESGKLLYNELCRVREEVLDA